MTQLQHRPRRGRVNAAMRRLRAETALTAASLVLPVFVKEGIAEPADIPSLPGIQQHTLDSLAELVDQAARAGLGGVMLFGVPAVRDATGTAADDPNGILNLAIARAVESAAGRLTVQADLCLDEFTDHGHCGVLDATGRVDNDATLIRYSAIALAQANAGADILGLSGMMDGQVAAVRRALDLAGHHDVSLLAYSAKYASAWYGPFRDAVESTLTGDRTSYQLDPANAREGLAEALADISEGADMVMVKPAGGYLDVLREVADWSTVPVWAYQVSGEYALLELAAKAGILERERAIREALLGIRRAGADVVLSYFALEVAENLGGGVLR